MNHHYAKEVLDELYLFGSFGLIWLHEMLSYVSFDYSKDHESEDDSFNKTDKQKISDFLILIKYVVVERLDFEIYSVQRNLILFDDFLKNFTQEILKCTFVGVNSHHYDEDYEMLFNFNYFLKKVDVEKKRLMLMKFPIKLLGCLMCLLLNN